MSKKSTEAVNEGIRLKMKMHQMKMRHGQISFRNPSKGLDGLSEIPVEPPSKLRYVPPQGNAVRLEKLKPGGCKWPDGDDHPMLFCNAATGHEGPYCEAHSGIAYGTPKTSMKELARSLRKVQ